MRFPWLGGAAGSAGDRAVRHPGAMARRPAAAFALAACLVAVAAGCGSGGSSSSGPTVSARATPQRSEPRAGASKAPPPTVRVARAKSVSGIEQAEGSAPAAGVCPESSKPVMSVDLHPDTPSPRCVVLHPDQRLRIVNLTNSWRGKASVVRIDFAGFRTKLAPGHAAILDAPAGSYLGTGTHGLALEGAPAPQVWVK
jgi:hypothetical protein